MKLRAIWSFIAGDSRLAPIGVAIGMLLVLVLERTVPAAGGWIGLVFVAAIAGGLVAGVFERTG